MTDDTRKLIERAGEWLDAPDDGSSMAASVLIEEMKAVLEAVLPTEDDREKLEYIFASEFKASKVMAMLMANAVQGAGFRRSPVPPETDEAYIAWAAQEADREQARVFRVGLGDDFVSGWRDGFETGLLHRALAAVPPVTEETVTTIVELPVGTVFRAFYYPPSFGLPPENPHLAVVQLTRGHRIVHGERMEYPLDKTWERVEVLYRPVEPVPEGDKR